MTAQSITSRLPLGRTAALFFGALACCAFAAGAGTGARQHAQAATVKLPAKVAAHRLTRQGPPHGRTVSRKRLSLVLFPTGLRGFALATFDGATFPALTTDGGGTWTFDGPAFHIPAADGPEVIGADGAIGPKTFFAYGGDFGGQAVDVTTDAGKQWWEAFLPGEVAAVVPRLRGGLAAFVQIPFGSGADPRATTDVYISTDGGRHWRLSNTLV
jgi:hypothetical protein